MAEPRDSASPNTRVKICGITRVEDALFAAQAGADYLGYLLWSGSPRYVAPDMVVAIIAEVQQRFPAVQHVGVFVDAPLGQMTELYELCTLDIVQLHGAESPERCRELSDSGIRVMKALKFGRDAPPADWRDYKVSYFLCDTFDSNQAGGTGRAFDRSLLPDDLERSRIFLAGGLNAENVGAVVSAVRPFAVDVSSGVEESPGRKSHVKIEEFIRAVRAA